VSHELRTPLARQRTLLEVALRDRQATNATLRTACERALAAGEQQERLIAALLTLARGERGLDTFEPFDLGAIAANALASWHEEADARGLTVTADLGTAPALGDPRLAGELAANLADNAIRYNVDGGQVEITAGRREGRPSLAVTNTGPVIPPDQLSRLFQPFQRLNPGPRVQGGLGLGLAIVSAIAAAHGAEQRATARAAGGLAVEVIFPPPAGDGRWPRAGPRHWHKGRAAQNEACPWSRSWSIGRCSATRGGSCGAVGWRRMTAAGNRGSWRPATPRTVWR